MDVNDKEKDLIIDFEEDVISTVANSTSQNRSLTKAWHGGETLTSALDSTEPVLAEMEISDSFLSATFSTIQPLGNGKSIIILVIRCHPATKRRFINATVTWKFKPILGAASGPRVVALAPQYSVGGGTEEQTNLTWGFTLPVEVGFGGSSIGVEPTREIETQKTVMHAMTLSGSVRRNGTQCVWTIEENKSSARGIPPLFQLAVVVEHSGPFMTELDVKAELSGRSWSSYVQAKKGQDGKGLERIIDVDRWKCGEVVWGEGEAGWKRCMAELTGAVPGSVNAFGQEIVRP